MRLLMRLVDVVLAFPFLVLMLAIIAILGPGLDSFYIALALVGWVSYARLVRAQVLVLKTSDFVMAARSLGFGRCRILFRHILPNCIAGSIVFSMSDVVLVILVRLRDLLSRPRRAAADRRMGRDDRGGAELHHHRLVDHHLPRPRHRAHGLRLQPAGRRPGRAFRAAASR